MSDFYFYKGFRLVEKNGRTLVIAPSYRNNIVKITNTKNAAKLWIETMETQADIRKSAKETEKLLKTLD